MALVVPPILSAQLPHVGRVRQSASAGRAAVRGTYARALPASRARAPSRPAPRGRAMDAAAVDALLASLAAEPGGGAPGGGLGGVDWREGGRKGAGGGK